MTGHFDDLETRSPERREAELMESLPFLLARAAAGSAHAARSLSGTAPEDVVSREALARLPVTRKSDLIAAQTADPPFAGLNGVPVGSLARIFVSPGPIHEPQGRGADTFRFARALHATGLRAGNVVQNCFAYHFTPAGFMLEGGAIALGCPVIPAGTGNTDAQAGAMARLRPRAWCGTPDFLRIILERADALGLDTSSLRFGHVSGGAYLPALRQWYGDRGLTVLQSYATAECGMIAYESEAREGLILDEEVIVEIVRPGTGDPLPDGEVGEVVVTVLGEAYPLIRFATGDLSAIMPGTSPCGRTNTRIRGWMGRADQAAKVRGLFVRPEMVAALARQFPTIGRLRLVVSADEAGDRLELRAEAREDAALREMLADAVRSVTGLRGEVVLVAPGSLPNDGRMVDDTRPVPA
ncbi:phenylacetate--CoA ligase family protein [Roseomonas populi]|uniref:AMP-binding protein n=1 Tax=Roseomonas populi TaxID=3121582 RepID=A0ABT1X2S8_9PROT|nr:AMP-binding protein [Roseomonas pecuniae]MCR0982377.1 AMP-binding protein [Roseomonas pecuniae]